MKFWLLDQQWFNKLKDADKQYQQATADVRVKSNSPAKDMKNILFGQQKINIVTKRKIRINYSEH